MKDKARTEKAYRQRHGLPLGSFAHVGAKSADDAAENAPDQNAPPLASDVPGSGSARTTAGNHTPGHSNIRKNKKRFVELEAETNEIEDEVEDEDFQPLNPGSSGIARSQRLGTTDSWAQ